MSNGGRQVVVIGSGSAGLAAALIAVMDNSDIELVEQPRDIALTCDPLRLEVSERRFMILDPRPGNYERGGKRGSADWKEHSNRRGKFKRRNR